MNFVSPTILAEEAQALLQKLDPSQRAAVLAALFALVVVGVALVVFTWLGGRFVLRLSRRNPQPRPPIQSDWDRRQPASGNEPPAENE